MVIEEIEEYEEYFEEEIISYCGLSTIFEGDDESCSSRQSNPSSAKGPLSPTIPAQISLTPKGQNGFEEFSPKILALVSPTLFSPMAEARKMKISSFKSPLTGLRPKGAASPSPGGRRRNPPTIANTNMVLTNLETGEELVMDGDDDEFTFVSCSDIDSIMGGSMSSLDDSSKCLEHLPFSDGLECAQSSQTSQRRRLSWEDTNPTLVSHYEIDFEGAKKRLEKALERRMKKGKMGKLRAERMDFMRRKLQYELQRKMLKAELNQCLIPTKPRNER